MNPYLAAAAVYDREPCARTFEQDLFAHLTGGTVISTPEVFAMLRPVCRDWPLDWLRDPGRIEPEGDCWWIYCAAGDVRQLFGMLPPKIWVAFERSNTPRVWEYARLRRLLNATAKRQALPGVSDLLP